ncbi:MAG: hypothetical protein AB7H77_09870 [Bdellovibrionales bacterium]
MTTLQPPEQNLPQIFFNAGLQYPEDAHQLSDLAAQTVRGINKFLWRQPREALQVPFHDTVVKAVIRFAVASERTSAVFSAGPEASLLDMAASSLFSLRTANVVQRIRRDVEDNYAPRELIDNWPNAVRVLDNPKLYEHASRMERVGPAVLRDMIAAKHVFTGSRFYGRGVDESDRQMFLTPDKAENFLEELVNLMPDYARRSGVINMSDESEKLTRKWLENLVRFTSFNPDSSISTSMLEANGIVVLKDDNEPVRLNLGRLRLLALARPG